MHLGMYVVFFFLVTFFFCSFVSSFSFSCLLLGSFFLRDTFSFCLLFFIVFFFLFPPPPSIKALALSTFPATGETIVMGVVPPIVFLTYKEYV